MTAGHEVVADALRAHGVDTLFGLLGNTNLALAGVLRGHGVRFVGARHETGAISLAAGYAWSSGRPAACTVTHGPGLSNALTGLTSAVRDRAPVVLLVGDIRGEPAWMAQRADHAAMVAWTGAGLIDVDRPGRLAAAVAEGLGRAVRERRPMVVNIRSDLLADPAGAQEPARLPEEDRPPPADEACRALADAERPLILAGRGALWTGAGPALRDLGRRTGALLATTLPAKGLFHGDPYDLGVCGGYATATARELIRESDVVLAAGASLNGYTTDKGELLAGATVIRCDAVSPVAARRRGRRTPEIAARVAAARDFADESDDDGLDPRTVLRAVDVALPPDRQVVVDVGHFTTFPTQQLTVHPGRFLPALGFGSVGLALATGIGAARGRDAPTLVVVGDGGALMALGELETLARLRPRLTVLVLNDRAYGAEIHHLRRHGLPEDLALFPETDFAAVAAALGIPGISLRTSADLDRLAYLRATDGPSLVDARVTRAVVADKFAGRTP
ncbi:thiamine pyrophosphate-binding protein [Asanoa iriomotensis]|uniref:Acetolactate synthase I/II/III large subunit n=1 Tax=Asanoa iriomotensis TaxID=234613 RepID=A0ABQ4C073_9ACTN|nr:acetolactate synthase I/II/III large subunit [Asanoa iriomotensis]